MTALVTTQWMGSGIRIARVTVTAFIRLSSGAVLSFGIGVTDERIGLHEPVLG
jgi:hypothetical protein